MAKNARHTSHPAARIAESEALGHLTPREISRQEFGRRLAAILADKSWNQSDLARAADIGRDAVSTYVRGRSFPDPKNLKKISDALHVAPDTLLPNAAKAAIDAEIPALEMRQAAGHPEHVWLRVNQLVPSIKAFRVLQILMEE